MTFKKRSLTIIGIALVTLGLVVFAASTTTNQTSYKALAACLQEKNVVMYGVDTCDKCQNQKKIFGTDFEKITYVNCAFHAKECNALDSTGYPTWTMRGTLIAEGLTSLPELAQLTGCPLDSP